jgi:hypothetical protein
MNNRDEHERGSPEPEFCGQGPHNRAKDNRDSGNQGRDQCSHMATILSLLKIIKRPEKKRSMKKRVWHPP